MPSIDEVLEDFPKSELWRLQTDGCQATQGPNNFRPKFYQGMDAGFKFLNVHCNENITPELIEGIHRSAFQFEEDYASEQILQKGYSEVYGAFEIFLPVGGLESPAGVSEEGLDELIEVLRVAHVNKGRRSRPQYEIVIETNSSRFPILFNPNDYDSTEACKQALLVHLKNASGSKDDCTGVKTPIGNLTKVEIASNKCTREEVIAWVQEDINTYERELLEAKSIKIPQDRKQAEINAINHLVRKLHQCHYFPDGNGRTFVFLLANLLLMQNGYGMKITQNPAHYAAFSSQQLLQETIHDLDHFNQYKITNAKNYLQGLTQSEINTNKEGVATSLTGYLNEDPLIAMAQIDELYAQVRTNKLVVPTTYIPEQARWFSFLATKPAPEDKLAHIQVLHLLEKAYVNKLGQLVDNVSSLELEKRIGYGAKETPGEVLEAMVCRQSISKALPEVRTLISQYDAAATATLSPAVLTG